MVKRKADISLDEWLNMGVASLPTSSANTTTNPSSRAADQAPTAEGLHAGGTVPLATGGLVNTSSETVHRLAGIPVNVAQGPVPLSAGRPVGVAIRGSWTVTGGPRETERGRHQPTTIEPAGPFGTGPQPVTAATDDVAINGEDISEWFWHLLEQAGYERW